MKKLTACLVVSLAGAAYAQSDSLGSPIGDLQEQGAPLGGGFTFTGDITMADAKKVCFGDTTCDYWFVYNSSGTQFELWHTDVDGGGSDGLIYAVSDGSDDPTFTGVLTATGGLIAAADSVGLCSGTAGCSDSDIYFDGTSFQITCPGCTTAGSGIVLNAPLIVDRREHAKDTDNGCDDDIEVTSSAADNTVVGYTSCVDGNRVATIFGQSDGADGADELALRLPQGVLLLDEVASSPTAIASAGAIFTKSDNILYFIDGAGAESSIGGIPSFRSYTHQSRTGASGTDYIGGFYFAPAADADLTQASLTVNMGAANVPYAAHAFLVASAAGTTDGSDLVVTVSGTSITDGGTRTGADSEVIIGAGADVTACQVNATSATTDLYCETDKKWIGQTVFTLSSSGGATFAFTFNYGLAKYEDFGNRDFTIRDFECTGLAEAADTSFDIQLMHHKLTSWTYHATAFVPGTGALYSMNTIHSTEQDLDADEPFAFKRASLTDAVDGDGSEGTVIKVVTGVNNSVGYMNCHLGVTL